MQYVENTRHSVLKELSTHTGMSKCFDHAMGYNMGELKSFKDVPTNHAAMYKCVQTPPPAPLWSTVNFETCPLPDVCMTDPFLSISDSL